MTAPPSSPPHDGSHAGSNVVSKVRYYDRLAAERLRRCYELAPPAVRAYLDAEIDLLRAVARPADRVLELGCGYGRVLAALAGRCRRRIGIDLSLASLALARHTAAGAADLALARMDAGALGFAAASFDLVCCPQNGISALHVEPRALLAESVRLLRPGGRALFFSYAESFWPERLEWFRIQSAHGLVGEIDDSATGDGTIVCRDGFVATTFAPRTFADRTRDLAARVTIEERGASVVCTLEPPATDTTAPPTPPRP